LTANDPTEADPLEIVCELGDSRKGEMGDLLESSGKTASPVEQNSAHGATESGNAVEEGQSPVKGGSVRGYRAVWNAIALINAEEKTTAVILRKP